MILLMNQTWIVVPQTMRKRLMDREHLAHPVINKMKGSFRAKYFWPGIQAGGIRSTWSRSSRGGLSLLA